jgi:hypothetical protein
MKATHLSVNNRRKKDRKGVVVSVGILYLLILEEEVSRNPQALLHLPKDK